MRFFWNYALDIENEFLENYNWHYFIIECNFINDDASPL